MGTAPQGFTPVIEEQPVAPIGKIITAILADIARQRQTFGHVGDGNEQFLAFPESRQHKRKQFVQSFAHTVQLLLIFLRFLCKKTGKGRARFVFRRGAHTGSFGQELPQFLPGPAFVRRFLSGYRRLPQGRSLLL